MNIYEKAVKKNIERDSIFFFYFLDGCIITG